MNENDLSKDKTINLAEISLDYEKFKALARNKHISPEEKIGFPQSYRKGFEGFILKDISHKLQGLTKSGGSFFDIGCGSSLLTSKLLDLLDKKNIQVYLNDSEEVLSLIDTNVKFTKVVGKFPEVIQNLNANIIPEAFDYILCYSVIHYIFVEMNIFEFVDAILEILKPGGIALIGDIPNISKRKRFFSSNNGKEYHKEFTKTDSDPTLKYFNIERKKIDDSVLDGIVQRARAAGYNAYVLPQAPNLPMSNRRDDLLIQRP